MLNDRPQMRQTTKTYLLISFFTAAWRSILQHPLNIPFKCEICMFTKNHSCCHVSLCSQQSCGVQRNVVFYQPKTTQQSNGYIDCQVSLNSNLQRN